MIGLIGQKEGMPQYFSEDGTLLPATVIKIDKNVIVNLRTTEKDGFNSLVIGSVDMKEKKAIKPYKGQFRDGIALKKHLREFKVDKVDNYEIGQEVGLEIFEGVKYLDIIGKTKGKGFQGVMKRHGFSGGPKSHGSKFHRQNGSTGQSAWPSRGFKGIKRAGRMGNDITTAQNLQVIEYNNENSYVIVKGCIPGKNKSIVYLKKAKKKSWYRI